MMQGTYTAALGIMSQQQRIDTIANNLANVQTNGFKSSRADFKDALYQTMQRPVAPQDGLNMEKGHGTLISGFVRNFVQGFMYEDGGPTDLYLNSDNAWFTVQSQTGERAYTRDGQFKVSVEAGGNYLVTSFGYVLDQNGQRIKLAEEGELSIDKAGVISSVIRGKDENGEETITTTPYARLGIVSFPNQEGLEATAGNLFRQTEASGAPRATAENEYEVRQGAYEGSNVKLEDEFSRLIRGTRMLQLSSRALSTADEMDETALSTRR